IFRTPPDTTFPEPTCLSASPPNAPPRQSKRQGQRTKRPVAVYNLCLELEDGDNPNPSKEDTPTSSLDSLSSPSPVTAALPGPPGPDKNHLLADGGSFGDWASTIPGQTRSSMVQWLNPQSPTTTSSNPAVTPPSPGSSPFLFSPPATVVDKPPESVSSRKARAVYPCEAEHSSELSFEIGAIFEDDGHLRDPTLTALAACTGVFVTGFSVRKRGSLSHLVPSLSLLELVLLLEEKGNKAAFLKLQHSQDHLLPRVLSNDTFQELQTPQCVIPRWSRIKQKPENVLESHKCPKQETKNKTKSTEKVERLQDNRRGLSVVIYNRDCKMVN
ncbi:hypothetical protein H8959_008900, partial [Pygathrix nigripes]